MQVQGSQAAGVNVHVCQAAGGIHEVLCGEVHACYIVHPVVVLLLHYACCSSSHCAAQSSRAHMWQMSDMLLVLRP
jgi:hypothetical protein